MSIDKKERFWNDTSSVRVQYYDDTTGTWENLSVNTAGNIARLFTADDKARDLLEQILRILKKIDLRDEVVTNEFIDERDI